MSEKKIQKSERLKEKAAKEINERYRNDTLWVKEKKKQRSQHDKKRTL